jgi:hypothetical protein
MRVIHEDRFWSKIAVGDACWLWLAGCDADGYGKFWLGDSNKVASRVAWELTHGTIPPGMEVCHDCPGGDEPRCVRPSHLFLGTRQDNVADMVAKGRSLSAERSPSRQHPERLARGREHGRSVLDEDCVRAIRARRTNGDTHVALAEAFGISPATVSQIVLRKTWRHVA